LFFLRKLMEINMLLLDKKNPLVLFESPRNPELKSKIWLKPFSLKKVKRRFSELPPRKIA